MGRLVLDGTIDADVSAPLMSLPRRMGDDRIPAGVPYLEADPKRIADWRARFSTLGGLKIDVLLPFAPDWRWGREGETSPWYPSARLFRQGHGEDWPTVAQRMAVSLKKLTA